MFEAGKLNQTYDRVLNCRVVRPPYDIAGAYSNEFFLDKRYGLESVFSDAAKEFLDFADVSGRRYYLFKESGKVKVGTFNGASFVTVSPTDLTYSGCDRMVKARGAKWAKINTEGYSYTAVDPATGVGAPPEFPYLPWYTGGYVTFKYTGGTALAQWQYVTFRSGLLNGSTCRIEYVSGTYPDQVIHVIGTNQYGSLPFNAGQSGPGATFDVYPDPGTVLAFGHSTGVTYLTLNGYDMAGVTTVPFTEPVLDIQPFNARIFALTQNKLLFTNSNLSSNTNFYYSDYFDIDNGMSLFNMGKSMLVFADTNRLVSRLENVTAWTTRIVAYDCNYAGKPYSKHSFIFADQTIQVLQSNKQLMELNIVQFDVNTFDIVTKDAMSGNRGLFELLPAPDGGDQVHATMTERYLNYVLKYGTKSRVYQYDKQLQHWLINEYDVLINKFSDEIMCAGAITKEAGYLDLDQPYSQSVVFSLNPWPRMQFVHYVRTMFGMIPSTEWEHPLDVTLSTDFEIEWRLDKFDQRITGMQFDTRFSETPTSDEMVDYDELPKEVTEYDGSFASVQTTIMKTWRVVRIEYVSDKRFQLGHSTVYWDETKPTINEISQST